MATNRDTIFGFKAVNHAISAGTTGRVRKYIVPAADGTALFLGDAVKTYGTADSTTGLSTVIQAAAGDAIRGVVVGFEPVEGITIANTNLSRTYRPASTKMVVLVNDDPYTIFEIQEDAVGATTALVDVGENADITVGSGDTATGLSGMELDSSTHTSATAQLRILGFARREDNVVASANAKLLVMINEHELKSTTGV